MRACAPVEDRSGAALCTERSLDGAGRLQAARAVVSDLTHVTLDGFTDRGLTKKKGDVAPWARIRMLIEMLSRCSPGLPCPQVLFDLQDSSLNCQSLFRNIRQHHATPVTSLF